MTETVWSNSITYRARAGRVGALARLWASYVAAPLHRALDAALRADQLRGLNGSMLADIGLRRD